MSGHWPDIGCTDVKHSVELAARIYPNASHTGTKLSIGHIAREKRASVGGIRVSLVTFAVLLWLSVCGWQSREHFDLDIISIIRCLSAGAIGPTCLYIGKCVYTQTLTTLGNRLSFEEEMQYWKTLNGH